MTDVVLCVTGVNINGKQRSFIVEYWDYSISKYGIRRTLCLDSSEMLQLAKEGYEFRNAIVLNSGVVRVDSDIPRYDEKASQVIEFPVYSDIGSYLYNGLDFNYSFANQHREELVNNNLEIYLDNPYRKIKQDRSSIKTTVIQSSYYNEDPNNILTSWLGLTLQEYLQKHKIESFMFISNICMLDTYDLEQFHNNFEGLLIEYDIMNIESLYAAVETRFDYIFKWAEKTGQISQEYWSHALYSMFGVDTIFNQNLSDDIISSVGNYFDNCYFTAFGDINCFSLCYPPFYLSDVKILPSSTTKYKYRLHFRNQTLYQIFNNCYKKMNDLVASGKVKLI